MLARFDKAYSELMQAQGSQLDLIGMSDPKSLQTSVEIGVTPTDQMRPNSSNKAGGARKFSIYSVSHNASALTAPNNHTTKS
jgi:hypothetical protein